MRIEIRVILSMRQHGASCHLLILDNRTHILLDCGINANLDFSQYRANEKILSKVEIVLITHPSLAYLGALPFLLEEFNISPKVYATQPVIILGPLNIHEAMLNQRYEKYNTEVLRRIYSRFESVISVKPLQRKRFELEPGTGLARPEKEGDNPHHHSIHLICYQSGSEIGAVCWRISYCMFSCVYLVGYSNYKQYHMEGMDLDSLIARKTDILITDCYTNDRQLKGLIRRQAMKDLIMEKIQGQLRYPDGRRLIFSCSPNERLVELMSILTQLSSERAFEGRVDMVHYSSSYQQLIRSQTDYKIVDEPNNDDDQEQKVIQPPPQQTSIFDKDFNFSKKLQNRICITTSGACRPDALLWSELIKLGEESRLIRLGQDRTMRYLPKPFEDLQAIFSQPIVKTEPMAIEERKEESPVAPPPVKIEAKNIMSGQYIHCFSFPRFVGRHNQHPQYDSYGEHYEADLNNSYGSMPMDQQPLEALPRPQQKKKKMHVDNHHVEFKLPQPTNVEQLKIKEERIDLNDHTTTFESSLQIISLLNPQRIILVNGAPTDYETYNREILEQRSRSLATREDPSVHTRKFEIFNFERKKYLVFENNNETIEQSLNLFSEELRPHNDLGPKNVLKVTGSVVLRPNNSIDIILVESGERELMQFNMAQFYRSIASQHCRFTDNGVLEINDVKLYRRKNEITIEGTYSMQYFRLRELLYRYVELQSN